MYTSYVDKRDILRSIRGKEEGSTGLAQFVVKMFEVKGPPGRS